MEISETVDFRTEAVIRVARGGDAEFARVGESTGSRVLGAQSFLLPVLSSGEWAT